MRRQTMQRLVSTKGHGLDRGVGLAALALLLLGCGSGNHAESASGPRRDLHVEVGVLPGAGSVVTFNGVRIEVHADVSLTLPSSLNVSITSSDGRPKLSSHAGKELLVDGQVLDIVDGRLVIGGVDHGAVSPGDVVRIDAQGAFVNDVRHPTGERGPGAQDGG